MVALSNQLFTQPNDPCDVACLAGLVKLFQDFSDRLAGVGRQYRALILFGKADQLGIGYVSSGGKNERKEKSNNAAGTPDHHLDPRIMGVQQSETTMSNVWLQPRL